MPNNTNDPTQNVARPNEKTQLDELRNDIDELAVEVRTSVDDLKKCVAEIRSEVSEIENPFNVQKTVPNEKDTEKLNQASLPGVKSIDLGKEEIVKNEDDDSSKVEDITLQIEDQTPKKCQKIVAPLQIKPKASEYVGWIWDLLEVGLNADNIRQLASSCELMGYFTPQTNELIYSLAVTAEKFRSLGLTEGHLLLFLYKAAAMSKTNIDAEDMETLISVAEHQLENPKPARGTT